MKLLTSLALLVTVGVFAGNTETKTEEIKKETVEKVEETKKETVKEVEKQAKAEEKKDSSKL